jgi:hypothetical protein
VGVPVRQAAPYASIARRVRHAALGREGVFAFPGYKVAQQISRYY